MEYIEHRFSPCQTIKAAIRKYNNQTQDDSIMQQLVIAYYELNPKENPRVGDTVKIPLYDFGDEPTPVNNKPVLPPIPPSNPVQAQPESFEVKLSQDIEIEMIQAETTNTAMMDRQARRERARQAASGQVPQQRKKMVVKPTESVILPKIEKPKKAKVEELEEKVEPKPLNPVEKKVDEKKIVVTPKQPQKKRIQRKRVALNPVAKEENVEDTPKKKKESSGQRMSQRDINLRKRRKR